MSRLKLTCARGHADVQRFFDACAPNYAEQHGNPERLLRRRLAVIRRYGRFRAEDTALEIGCGDGRHLIALSEEFAHGVGIDLSPAMIECARQRAQSSPAAERVALNIDLAECMSSVSDASIDVAFCVGALEHMIDHTAMFHSAFRVLRPGGRLVCLTLNGDFIWYNRLAPALGIETRRLSTDHYLSRGELDILLNHAGFRDLRFGHWTFVPRGDMDVWSAAGLQLLDWFGRFTRIGRLRGGLVVCARRPAAATAPS
jgi:ubiquinone/menaquinone biosynthesis C-methylase UbiE